jgi:hypothetical protein
MVSRRGAQPKQAALAFAQALKEAAGRLPG